MSSLHTAEAGSSSLPAPTEETLTTQGCDGNTGGGVSSRFLTTQPQIITWFNDRTTELGGAKVSTTENEPDTRGEHPPLTPPYEVSGVVKADTTGSAPVLGKYHYELCFVNGVFENEPGSNVKIG